MTATSDTGQLPTVSTAPPAVPAAARASASVASAFPATPATAGIVERLRSLGSRRLAAPGGVVLGLVVLTPGVLLDLSRDGTFGLASSVMFVLAGMAVAFAVRSRALATAAVLPPLLFLAAVAAVARFSGVNEGNRELALDIGTTLAVWAPVLFGGTLAALAVVLGRLVAGLVRR